MALYLNNLDLNGNQLIKATIHPLSSAPATAQEGQIYYDTGASAVYVNTSTTPSSPAWVSMAGDMTGITLTGGNGITATNTNSSGGAYSSTITLDISDSTLTTATAIAQADLFAFSDESETGQPTVNISFTNLEDQIFANMSGEISVAAGGAVTIQNNTADTSGTAAAVTNATLTTALTVNTGTVTLTGNSANSSVLTIGAGAVSVSGSNTGDQVLPTDFVSAANGGTFSGNVSFGDNDITNVGVIKVDEIKADNATIKIGVEASKAITIGIADTTYVDGNGDTQSNNDQSNVTVGHDLTVAGELTVNGGVTLKGDVILETTTNTALKDKILLLNQGASGTPASTDDFGILFSRGFGTTGGKANMMIKWDESDLEWQLIATNAQGTESGAVGDLAGSGGEGEDVLGDSGFQHLRVGKMSSVTFHGNGASLTDLSGSAITSGTVAAARVATLNQSTTGSAGSVANSLTVDDTTVGLSAGTNYNGSTAKTISAKTASIADGGAALATADQIHTFVTTQTDAIAANTSGTAAGLSATLAVASGGTGATSLDSAGIVEKSGAQTIAGVKTFTSGLILDDAGGAAPIIKWVSNTEADGSGDDQEFSVFNTSAYKLRFMQGATARMDLDSTGLDVVNGIKINGSAVHATDTTTTLGTSDTKVPSQNAVKTYVDSQSSSSGNTGGRQAFVLGHATTGVEGNTGSADGNNIFTITHGMGSSRNYGVEVIRNGNNSGGGETVIVDVTRPSDTTIVITFASAVTALDYTALVCKY